VTAVVRHPLAPLSAQELATACRIVKSSGLVGSSVRIVWCALDEPPKETVLGWNGERLPRRALCAVYERTGRRTSLLTVSLDDNVVILSSSTTGVQPQILDEEWFAGAECIKADPRYQNAMARRGVTDMSLVRIEPWPAGNFGLEIDASGRRLGRGVSYIVDSAGANPYAHPVENLVAIVDRDTCEVIEVQEGEVVPIPTGSGRYDAVSVGSSRQLAPLSITQEDGPGFAVDDGELRWGPWGMHLSMHPIEGLVLHHIHYIDGGRMRPIVYRASVSEMVVPYGSTGLNHWWKNAFDAGDCGLGKLAGSMDYGCECLGEIVYLDAVGVDENGNALTIPRAICVHEEDYGVLWRHRDVMTGSSEVRRSRRLVVSCFATVGNYDYGFFWYFYLDGTIEAQVKLTGIILAQAIGPGARVPFANPVTPELVGPHHQHLFNFRLDMCVDGPRNSVYEVDALPVPLGPDNPYGNAFTARSTLLERESQAQRMAAPERSRCWTVVNSGSHNACGEPVGYRLVPTHAAALLAHETAAVVSRAGFATRHLWVTPFDAEQRRAAGDFPNQHPGGAGLPAWVESDRPLVDTDIVLWHTIGSTHFCRPEDFPIMPCEYVGFLLKPVGFFDANPALNLAPPTANQNMPVNRGGPAI